MAGAAGVSPPCGPIQSEESSAQGEVTRGQEKEGGRRRGPGLPPPPPLPPPEKLS